MQGEFERVPVKTGVEKHISSFCLRANERGAVFHYCPGWYGDYFDRIAFNYASLPPLYSNMMIPPLTIFDRLDYPPTLSVTDDIGHCHLQQMGIVNCTELEVHGEASNAMLRRDAYDVYRAREATAPGGWSIWHLIGDDPIPADESDPEMGFRLRLQDALVFPAADTPLEALLGFKERRTAEIQALRHHIDELCLKVSREGDWKAARIEAERFETALRDHVKVSREPNWSKLLGSLNIEMNWSSALIKSMMAGAAAQALAPAAVALAVGIAAASELSIKTTRGAKRAGDLAPFAFAAQIDKEFMG